jgi:hypothetical protein
VFLPQMVQFSASVFTFLNQNYHDQYIKFNSKNSFTTWHKLNPYIQDDINNPVHQSVFLAWEVLEHGLKKYELIGDDLQ